MPPLSEHARIVLDRMEPGRLYESQDLRTFAPDASSERLRELMHELWVNRRVERVGYAAWRRHRSAAPHAPDRVSRPPAHPRHVKPEDLFDHAAFEDFFK